MTRTETRDAIQIVLTGAVIVLGGAYFSLNASTEIAALVLIFALLRICWLEDNIGSDLCHASRLPQSYVNAIRRRRRFLWNAFGILPDTSAEKVTPQLLATSLHAQAEALCAAGLAALSVLILRGTGEFSWMAFGLGTVVLAGALWRVNNYVEAISHVNAEVPLPRQRLFICSSPWANRLETHDD